MRPSAGRGRAISRPHTPEISLSAIQVLAEPLLRAAQPVYEHESLLRSGSVATKVAIAEEPRSSDVDST